MAEHNIANCRKAFKAYDIRGRVPEELNEEVAYRIGRAYAQLFNPKQVVVGYDVRLTSPALAAALTRGLREEGCRVADIGLCGTEQVYFATFHLGLDGGIMVTASHNPQDYNGMKLVQGEARPISGDSGLRDLEELVVSGNFESKVNIALGDYRKVNIMDEYVQHLLSYIDISLIKPLKMVVNAGNGSAGQIIDALEPYLPVQFIKVHHNPDGTFPNGIPNPLLPENREVTAEVVRQTRADVGIAWDGDFDRCFLFDEQGNFIEGYYIVGLLAQSFLSKHIGAKIIHDPRLTWNTIDLVKKIGGVPIQSKTGHAFIKERMRLEDAVYGGEMSAHHYFKEFAYCDSGMIPWLLILEIMCKQGKPLSELINERIKLYPASGEINRRVNNPQEVLKNVEQHFVNKSTSVDWTDGLSLEFDKWRFNLRMSNTEPVIRLNVEAKNDLDLMKQNTSELLKIIDVFNKQ
ncbi:phosphomannomutase [Desulforamulus reducens MI-1]|uniref:Phosphomannomutase n=1 Tax=Desulforamulus reducens (strain ATCC BAA-1160 / DSM 100696 / MI-1) TaxID=349161 RepID=A4J975_DESRM|nr:phosphomannomutase/phosphoglucomutase [Desulforamulus reducens]ABO51628.1 phosphomannomutase [Desulforamulus reducens MI-1]